MARFYRCHVREVPLPTHIKAARIILCGSCYTDPMKETFAAMLAEGGRKNSLGRAEEVVRIVLADKARLEELYQCLSEDDAWLRMRAIDAYEKVCRVHPEWIEPHINRLFDDFGSDGQPSIQWHIAEIAGETALTPTQKERAIAWLVARLEDPKVDWIVASNSMNTLVKFQSGGLFPKEKLVPLLKKQLVHRSNAVKKRATKLLETLG